MALFAPLFYMLIEKLWQTQTAVGGCAAQILSTEVQSHE